MEKMRRHKRWGSVMALFCCLCLFLAACGEGEPVEETTSKTERAVSVNNGTLNEDSIAVSVGKTTVPYKEYKAYYYEKNIKLFLDYDISPAQVSGGEF